MLATLAFNGNPKFRDEKIEKHLALKDEPIKGFLGYKIDMVSFQQSMYILLHMALIASRATIPR